MSLYPVQPIAKPFLSSIFLMLAVCSLTILQGCITINENGYRAISKKQKAALQPYSANPLPGRLVEVTAGDIRNTLDAHAYTWVHIWIPYCKGPNCKPLPYYELIHAQHAGQGMQTFLVSHVYDVKQLPATAPVYVIKDSVYGHKMYKNMKAFYTELLPGNAISKQQPAHLLFKRDKLVYWGAHISNAVVDSVIQHNN